MTIAFLVLGLVLVLATGCMHESPTSTAVGTDLVAPVQNAGRSSVALVEENFTVEGGAAVGDERRPIVPFGPIHLRVTFRVDGPAAEHSLALPVIYLRRKHRIREPRTNEMIIADVTYNGEFPKKTRDGNRVTLDVVMRAPSKAGAFRAEVLDSLHPTVVLASHALVVEEPEKTQ